VGGGGSTIGGSGTINRVPKFTASTTLGNSSIVDSASAVAMTINPSGNVGINNTAPVYKLDLTANSGDHFRLNSPSGQRFTQLYFSNNSTSKGSLWLDNTNSFFELYGYSGIGILLSTNAIERMRITSGGNVGIGSYTSPAAKFVVDGTTLINTNTDNGVDKLQVSGSMNVSAKATVQNLSVTNSAQITNNLDMGSGTADANFTILANNTSSGWAGRFIGRNSSGIMLFQHRNNSATFRDCFYVDANGGIGNTVFLDRAFIAPGQAATGVLVVNSGTWSGNDELEVNGSISGIGFKQAYVAKTGAYTATNDDYVIDCTSGTFTVTLPASSGRTGRILIIKNSGAGTITVDGNASETIDGATTVTMAVQYGTIQIMSDGTNWKTIAKF
jgi:hypothetical protein